MNEKITTDIIISEKELVELSLTNQEDDSIDISSCEYKEEELPNNNANLDEIINLVEEDEIELTFVNENGEIIDFNESKDWTPSLHKSTSIEGVDGEFTEYVSNTNSDVSIFINEEIETDL